MTLDAGSAPPEVDEDDTDGTLDAAADELVAGDRRPAPKRPSWWEIAWLVVVFGFAVGSLITMSDQGWLPVGDDAVVVSRSRDVISPFAPTLGMPTSLVRSTGEPTQHPGPLLFVWLAPFVNVFGATAGGAAGAVALNMAAVVACWWFARALAGVTAGIAAGTLALLAAISLVPLYLPLNSSLSAAATFATFITAWAVLHRVPLATWALLFFASMAAQSHVAYAVAGLTVAVPVVGWDLVRRWREAEGSAAGDARQRAVAPLVLFTLLLWLGPLLDRGRNMVALLRSGGAGYPARGVGEAAGAVVGALGSFPVTLTNSEYFDVAPAARDVNHLFEAPWVLGSAIGVVVGFVLVGVAIARGHRLIRTGTVVLALASLGAFIGVARLPIRDPIGVQLFWAQCLSLFAFFLYAVAAGLLIGDRRDASATRATPLQMAAGAIVLVVVAAAASRSLEPEQTTRNPERAMAQEITRQVRDAEIFRTDEDLAMVALGGVATPGAVAAEQALFGVAATRIEQDRPTVLDAIWYWGAHRSIRGRRQVMPAVVFTARPLEELPEGWTELAHVDGPKQPIPGLARRVASSVLAMGQDVELAAGAEDIVPTVVDGYLPTACEDIDAWLDDPQRFAEEAPEALVELYRAGLVTSPALPPTLRSELFAAPIAGLWVYEVQGYVPRNMARNDQMTLSTVGCDR